jgi:hypothetical protein
MRHQDLGATDLDGPAGCERRPAPRSLDWPDASSSANVLGANDFDGPATMNKGRHPERRLCVGRHLDDAHGGGSKWPLRMSEARAR